MTEAEKIALLCKAIKALTALHEMHYLDGMRVLKEFGYDSTLLPMKEFVAQLREEALVAAGDKLPQP